MDVSASKLKHCQRQFMLSRKLQATLDPSLIHWIDTNTSQHTRQVTDSFIGAVKHYVSIDRCLIYLSTLYSIYVPRTHMECTVEADGLLTMDVSSCGCKARFLMSRCEGMMDKPTLRYEQLACGKLFCPVVPRCVHPRTPQLQLCT